MLENLINQIFKRASLVPGLMAFVNVDLSAKAVELNELELKKAIVINETPQGIYIDIAIFIAPDVRTKAVIWEISTIIEKIFNENKMKLKKINVNIRGIK